VDRWQHALVAIKYGLELGDGDLAEVLDRSLLEQRWVSR
jgi:hypothetical protein